MNTATLASRMLQLEQEYLTARFEVDAGLAESPASASILRKYGECSDPDLFRFVMAGGDRLHATAARLLRFGIAFETAEAVDRIDSFNLRRRVDTGTGELSLHDATRVVGSMSTRDSLRLHKTLVAIEQEVMQYRLAERWQRLDALSSRKIDGMAGLAALLYLIDPEGSADMANRFADCQPDVRETMQHLTASPSPASYEFARWQHKLGEGPLGMEPLVGAVFATLESLGIGSAEAISIDTSARENKRPGSRCHRISPDGETRISHDPGQTPAAGLVLMRCMGQAAALSSGVRADSPDAADTLGALICRLGLDPEWHRMHLEPLEEPWPAAIEQTLRMITLFDAGGCMAEACLHRQPGLVGLDIQAARLMRDATGLRHAREFFLRDLSGEFTCTRRLLAAHRADALREELLQGFGRHWWSDREAGNAIVRQLRI